VGAGMTVCLVRHHGGLGFRPKTRNRVFVAQFWACRVKRQCRTMLGRGGCGLMRWRWWGSCIFSNTRPGDGIWAKNPKTERLWLGFGHAV
jgi:hypothetical protein